MNTPMQLRIKSFSDPLISEVSVCGRKTKQILESERQRDIQRKEMECFGLSDGQTLIHVDTVRKGCLALQFYYFRDKVRL